jgi:hypothetical protein
LILRFILAEEADFASFWFGRRSHELADRGDKLADCVVVAGNFAFQLAELGGYSRTACSKGDSPSRPRNNSIASPFGRVANNELAFVHYSAKLTLA